MLLKMRKVNAPFIQAKSRTHLFIFRRTFSNSDKSDIFIKTLAKVREASKEIKGQMFDVSDMCSSVRIRRQDLESHLDEMRKYHTESDTKALQSLVTTLKSYCIRMSSLQGESESVHRELEEFLSTNTRTTKSQLSEKKINKPNASTVVPISEAEVELEEKTQTSSTELTVNEITEYLHEKSIDFSDCFDQASLEKRYLDVKSGIYQPPKKITMHKEAPSNTKQQSFCSIREPVSTERKSNGNNTSGGEKMNYGGSSQQGITPDPYPGAERRMCDPMKYVWEVKQDICQGKGVNSSQVDIWCGPIKLEDHRRMYEYPQCQRAPMEVRMKGDTRINKNLC